MIKFVISAERFADACSLPDYLGVILGRMGNQLNVLPKMIVAVGNVESLVARGGRLAGPIAKAVMEAVITR